MNVLVVLLLTLSAAAAASRDTYVLLQGTNSNIKVLGVPASFGGTFPPASHPISGHLVASADLSSSLGCQPADYSADLNAIVLVHRGNCSFVHKTVLAQQALAKAIIIVNSQDDQAAFPMSAGEASDKYIFIPSLMVSKDSMQSLQTLLDTHQDIHLSEYTPKVWDTSILCLLVLAVAVLMGGAYWGSLHERARSQGLVYRDLDIPEDEIQYLNTGGALSFILIASLGLILLFFFLDSLIYILFGMFMLGGGSSFLLCLTPLARHSWPSLSRSISIPALGETELTQLLMAPIAYGTALWWLFARHSDYAWILQDILGISLLLVIQRSLRLPNIKVSSILLVMAFFYDVFWVFLSPLLFTQSVMVHVATGGETGEAIPMLLRFPRLNDELGGYSMLGLGDIALPGLFISYLLRFDYEHHLHGTQGYFALAVVGYTVGLALTDVALVVFQSGQPALLYLVPCTLGLVSVLAYQRGHLMTMWQGVPKLEHERLSDESSTTSLEVL